MKTTSFFCLVLFFLFIGIESVSSANTIDRDSIKIPLEVNFCKLYDLKDSDSGRPRERNASVYHNLKRKRTKSCSNSFIDLEVSNNDVLDFKYALGKTPIKVKLEMVKNLKKLRVSSEKTHVPAKYFHGEVYDRKGEPLEGVSVSDGKDTVVTDVMGRYAFKYSGGDINLKFKYKLKPASVGAAEGTATITVNTGDDKHARVDVFFDDDKKDVVPAN